ncbi:MAG TPA: DUF5667 domain-containing protein [Anaerolineales bacterium]|nr:DUF5667 domain-containing protein [Anaerolineales bacterium]
MNNKTEIESMIRERLNEVKEVPPRNPQVAARARARFLTQAVSAREAQRHKGWRPIFRMQQFAMNMAVTLLVIASLLIGGGTTVKAAQDDLPGEPLYVVKTFSEDIRLEFQTNPETKVDRLMQLAETRVEEMTRLIESGQTPPEQVSARLEQHLQQALQICSNLDDAALSQKLPRLRDELQQQESDMQRLQSHATQGAQSVLEQTRSMLQVQLLVVNNGLLNHEAFRAAVKEGINSGQMQTPPAAVPSAISAPRHEQNGQATTPPGGPGNGNGVGPTANPGEPHPHVTPTPKNDHPTPVNNGGGNDKDKDKGPKDKDPKNDKPGGKPNK